MASAAPLAPNRARTQGQARPVITHEPLIWQAQIRVVAGTHSFYEIMPPKRSRSCNDIIDCDALFHKIGPLLNKRKDAQIMDRMSRIMKII